jgi:hypothetical protein
VYQLHVHFAFPYGQNIHRDAYRVHNLRAVIENLELDPDYYAKITLHMAIPKRSLHFAALAVASPAFEEAGVGALDVKKEAVTSARECSGTTYRTRCPLLLLQPWCLSRAWSTPAA